MTINGVLTRRRLNTIMVAIFLTQVAFRFFLIHFSISHFSLSLFLSFSLSLFLSFSLSLFLLCPDYSLSNDLACLLIVSQWIERTVSQLQVIRWKPLGYYQQNQSNNSNEPLYAITNPNETIDSLLSEYSQKMIPLTLSSLISRIGNGNGNGGGISNNERTIGKQKKNSNNSNSNRNEATNNNNTSNSTVNNNYNNDNNSNNNNSYSNSNSSFVPPFPSSSSSASVPPHLFPSSSHLFSLQSNNNNPSNNPNQYGVMNYSTHPPPPPSFPSPPPAITNSSTIVDSSSSPSHQSFTYSPAPVKNKIFFFFDLFSYLMVSFSLFPQITLGFHSYSFPKASISFSSSAPLCCESESLEYSRERLEECPPVH
jgi:hypothetical protein